MRARVLAITAILLAGCATDAVHRVSTEGPPAPERTEQPHRIFEVNWTGVAIAGSVVVLFLLAREAFCCEFSSNSTYHDGPRCPVPGQSPHPPPPGC